MLGGKLLQHLAKGFDVFATSRQASEGRVLGGVDVNDFDRVAAVIDDLAPAVVINCVGVIKQRPEASDPLITIPVNALFPHRLAAHCRRRAARLVHISTDCVFSGRRGPSNEDDVPDPVDLYGRTKLLGEVEGSGALTLRTSIIGREAGTKLGLVEWFLSQPDGARVRGFRRALYTGVSTTTAANAIAHVLAHHADLDGLWQLAAEPISKFDLLLLLRARFGRRVDVDADDEFVCDRRLDGSRFASRVGFVAPSWTEMIEEIHDDTPARRWLKLRCAHILPR
jgi:dTDP-4-dehydrorhamnose reductase